MEKIPQHPSNLTRLFETREEGEGNQVDAPLLANNQRKQGAGGG